MSSQSQLQPAPTPGGRIRLTSTVALALTFLIIFSSAALVARVNYPPEAASMPVIIGVVGAALSFLQLLVELRASRGPYEEQINLRKDGPIYLWVWAFVVAVVAFGFIFAVPVMLFAYLRWRSHESWWLSLLLPLLVLALLYGLFQVALGVPLFEGLVTPLIKDRLA
jgi:Tripartite tricarboxylate transporter TctB family